MHTIFSLQLYTENEYFAGSWPETTWTTIPSWHSGICQSWVICESCRLLTLCPSFYLYFIIIMIYETWNKLLLS